MVEAEARGLGMMAGTPQAIEASEAAGQQALVQSERLPREMRPDMETVAAATGIVFGEPIGQLFVEATLPDGWKKQATEHSMHSDLVDDKGRVRAGIFYKAAFYDERADMHFRSYLFVGGDYEQHEVKVVNADGETIKDFGKIGAFPGDDPEWHEKYKKYTALQEDAWAWLDENYPDHRDPFAYWP